MTARMADVLTYLAAIVIAAIFLFPILWLISLALRTQGEVYLGAARFIPEEPTLENFRLILTDRAFGTYIWNALKLSGIGAAIAVICATPAAYVFSRRAFRGAGALMVAILSVQMISPLVLLMPLYRYMDRLGLLDSQAATIGVYAALGLPLSVWLLKTSFDAVPVEIEDAARVDGGSAFRVIWEVSLPLAAPGMASAFILSMIAGWSQFLVPFILLTKDSQLPIAVAIFNFAGSTSASTTQLLAAACLLAVGPALIVFLALQRVIVRSIMAGAIKG